MESLHVGVWSPKRAIVQVATLGPLALALAACLGFALLVLAAHAGGARPIVFASLTDLRLSPL